MQEKEQEFSFKSLFVPLTTFKAIHIIIIAGIVVYFNALFGEFIGDDIHQIINNPIVHSLNNIPLVFADSTFRFYRPIPFFFYTLLYSLVRETTFFYHLVQVFIHIANASLVFLLFKTFFTRTIALLAALIFLIHPINTEAVASIASLQDVLCIFFGLFALFLSQRLGKHSKGYWATICALLVLSLLSKETGIIFLPLIVIYMILFQKNHLRISIIIALITLCIYGFLRFIIAHNYPLNPGFNTQILQTVLFTSPKMLLFYLKTFFFPKTLFYMRVWLVTSPTFSNFYLPLLIDGLFIVLLMLLGFITWKNKKNQFSLFIFFLTWLILGMGVTLPIWLLDATVAERWFYFPIIGLLGILTLIFINIPFKRSGLKILSYVFIVILLCILGLRTTQRNLDWNSRIALYKHDAPLSNTPIMYELLATELIELRNYREANVQLNKFVSLDKNNSRIWYYKGIIKQREGNYAQAKDDLKKLLGTPNAKLAYKPLLQILINQENNYTEAKVVLEEALKKYPNDIPMWQLLAVIEYKLGHVNEASYAAQKANTSLDSIISGAP